MVVRVEFTQDAREDLRSYAQTGNVDAFLKKLLRLEAVGEDAGQPLGRTLAGWRTIVVGDRNWRILFVMDAAKAVATIWVIGDRDDDACYEIAERRLAKGSTSSTAGSSLATVMFDIARIGRKRRDR